MRRGAYSELLGPVSVGMFEPSVAYEDALAGTAATWIERQERPVALASPLLRSFGPIADLVEGPKRVREQRARSRRHLRALDFGLSWAQPAVLPPS